MSIFEIIGGVLLIFFGLAVVISVTLQEHKTNLGGALGGSMNDLRPWPHQDNGRTALDDFQVLGHCDVCCSAGSSGSNHLSVIQFAKSVAIPYETG